MDKPLLWDVFCCVIDNWGDAGVSWRLACALAAHGQRVRLWIDDAAPLAWMAPQGAAGVQVRRWAQPFDVQALAHEPPGGVWVQMFGCELPEEFIAARGAREPVWFNLEYLSAEPWVERQHALPSPVMHGAGQGLVRCFFFPGFTPATGGLLREKNLLARQAAFDRAAWLAAAHGVAPPREGELFASLFCYEPPALAAQLAAWQRSAQPVRLLVAAGRAAAAVHACPGCAVQHGALRLHFLPQLAQDEYDELLWACDVNFVRGEDSLTRALWAGQPFIWQPYPQPEDNAHHAKLDALLEWLQAPLALRRFMRVWCGAEEGTLPAMTLEEWGACVRAARERLLAQSSLAERLLAHAVQLHEDLKTP